MLVIIIVNLCDETACYEAKEESHTVEDESDGSLDTWVRQVLLTVRARVVLVAVAHGAFADTCVVAASPASIVVGQGLCSRGDLSCGYGL